MLFCNEINLPVKQIEFDGGQYKFFKLSFCSARGQTHDLIHARKMRYLSCGSDFSKSKVQFCSRWPLIE